MDSVKSKKAKTPVVQKTPKSAKKNDKSVNKTPLPKNDTPRPPKKQNGVQTPNKKGNATPKKTPKTDPKKKKTPPKKVEESEDEEDDEEDDSEIELNPELMKKLSEMQDDDDEDMEDDDDDDDEAEDDDDDDDEDDDQEDGDEEEDDDDDDDDDEEMSELDEDELKQLIQSLKGKKSKKEASTEPAKGGKKTETAKPEAKKPAQKESPKPKQSKEADKPNEAAAEIDKNDYLKSVKERDCRTLFMKGLPIDIKEEKLLQLSKDIQGVRIRKRVRKEERRTLCYAFLEFVDEATAEKNFKILSETKMDGKTIIVDYTGEKSLARPNTKTVIKELDPSKLYITGFPYSTTELELKQLIPKASTVTLPMKRAENRPLGFAFAKFEDAEVCSQELKRLNGKSFKDCTLVVLHANLMRKPKAVKRKSTDVKGKAKKVKLDKSKKAKKEEKMEEEEADDDDDDDEEDDDDDDDDDDDSDEE